MKTGILFFMISKVIWVVSGFVIHVGLGRMLGAELYGIFGVVISVISIGYLIMGNGVRQAVSKFSASDPDQSDVIARTGLKIQVVLSICITIVFVLLAKPGAILMGDPSLADYFMLAAVTIPPTGVLFVFMGKMEGLKQFGNSAATASTYAILKVVFVFLFVFLGFKVFGAILGMISSLIVTTVVAWSLCPNKQGKGRFNFKKLTHFGFPVMLYYIAIALIMHFDILFVKSLLKDDAMTGLYTASQALSRLIYFVFAAFSVVLLPTLSTAIKNEDETQVSRYIGQSLRYMLLLLVPVVAVISSTSRQLVVFFYSEAYAGAAAPLSLLSLGMGCLVVSLILCTTIQAYGKPKIALYIFLITIPVSIFLHLYLIPKYGLSGAAISTAATFCLSFLMSSVTAFHFFKKFVDPMSLVRIVLAAVPVYVLAPRIAPVFGNFLPLCYAVLFSLYVVLLFIVAEINPKDVASAKEAGIAFYRRRMYQNKI